MQAFRFRLQRVLEYRALQEGWAKDAFKEARAQVIKAEAELGQLRLKRSHAQGTATPALETRRTLEAFLQKLEDDISSQNTVIDILRGEEAKAKAEWLTAKKNLEALEKLREAAEAQWQKEESAEEQKGLDEWSSTRRAA